MKACCVLGAFGALAGVVHAAQWSSPIQNEWSLPRQARTELRNPDLLALTISADKASAVVGEVITFTLTAEFDAGYYLLDFNFDLNASDGTLGTASGMSFASWVGSSNAGTPSGADLTGIFGGQSLLLGPVDASNPIVLGTFTVTASQLGTLSYAIGPITGGASGNLFTTQVTTSGLGDTNEFASLTTPGFSQISDTVQIVPAPGAFAMLGFAGLLAAGRRR